MSQFCPNEQDKKRCVLAKNHGGECSLQGKNSLAVRKIEAQENRENRLQES